MGDNLDFRSHRIGARRDEPSERAHARAAGPTRAADLGAVAWLSFAVLTWMSADLLGAIETRDAMLRATVGSGIEAPPLPARDEPTTREPTAREPTPPEPMPREPTSWAPTTLDPTSGHRRREPPQAGPGANERAPAERAQSGRPMLEAWSRQWAAQGTTARRRVLIADGD